jgi:Ca2+-binding EF-hand superfamily protein
MPIRDFTNKLREAGYVPESEADLTLALCTDQGQRTVGLGKLKEYQKKLYPAISNRNAADVRRAYGRMNPAVQEKLAHISSYMQRNNISLESMHKQLDSNKDGYVTKTEFRHGASVLAFPNLREEDYDVMFEAMDVNGDGQLSVLEFGLYIKGAKVAREEGLGKLTPQMRKEMDQEIKDLFDTFDINKDGKITDREVVTTMRSLGYNIDLAAAQGMIKAVDKDGSGAIELGEFTALMTPIMLDHVFGDEVDSAEQFRAHFREGDVDGNGFLSMDELYRLLQKMKIDVGKQEFLDLMMEFDVDRDM